MILDLEELRMALEEKEIAMQRQFPLYAGKEIGIIYEEVDGYGVVLVENDTYTKYKLCLLNSLKAHKLIEIEKKYKSLTRSLGVEEQRNLRRDILMVLENKDE